MLQIIKPHNLVLLGNFKYIHIYKIIYIHMKAYVYIKLILYTYIQFLPFANSAMCIYMLPYVYI